MKQPQRNWDDEYPTYRSIVKPSIMLILFAASGPAGVLLADWLWRALS